MFPSACSHCGGAVYLEWFRFERKIFIEITCLNCARLWTPFSVRFLLDDLRRRGRQRTADAIEARLRALIDNLSFTVVVQ